MLCKGKTMVHYWQEPVHFSESWWFGALGEGFQTYKTEKVYFKTDQSHSHEVITLD